MYVVQNFSYCQYKSVCEQGFHTCYMFSLFLLFVAFLGVSYSFGTINEILYKDYILLVMSNAIFSVANQIFTNIDIKNKWINATKLHKVWCNSPSNFLMCCVCCHKMINYRPSMESYRSRIHIKEPHITIKILINIWNHVFGLVLAQIRLI